MVMNYNEQELSRRHFILAGMASSAGIAVAACEGVQPLAYPTATPRGEVVAEGKARPTGASRHPRPLESYAESHS